MPFGVCWPFVRLTEPDVRGRGRICVGVEGGLGEGVLDEGQGAGGGGEDAQGGRAALLRGFGGA